MAIVYGAPDDHIGLLSSFYNTTPVTASNQYGDTDFFECKTRLFPVPSVGSDGHWFRYVKISGGTGCGYTMNSEELVVRL